ncbi:hypothetical protein LTR36_007096 [Oleoguttula mirabilis]|uniref:Uncharacterized protein n=1 Tax=Oleoguttula mirabilis TaxID=1507867 RepID=A0AAV9JAB6_9PEZI|nr:hypothetical protein LTR36_007096 [Oleoguttula mirabilis]
MALLTSYKRTRSVARLLALLCLIGALVIFFQDHVAIPRSAKKHARRSAEHPANLDDADTTNDLTPPNITAIASINDAAFRRIHPRADNPPAADLTPFEKAQGNGCNYFNRLEAADAEQSQWTDWNQLALYGWHRAASQQFGMPPAMQGPVLGSIANGGLGAPPPDPAVPSYDPMWVMLDQNIGCTVGNQIYNPSGGIYNSIMYPSHGILIANNNYSPKYMITKPTSHFRGGPLVPLAAWSDVQFLKWQHLCTLAGTDVRSLKYIFRSNIVNDVTRNVIFAALAKSGIKTGPPPWPGKKYSMDSEEGKALLGTPNGNGVAWILFSHRAQLGWKTIESVQLFDDTMSGSQRKFPASNSKPSLLFNVVDYVPPAGGAGSRKRDMSSRGRRDSWADLAGAVDDLAM